MMARKKKEPTPAFPEIEANRHHDTRKNIPTEELRDFVADDETKPPKMLYPRDPSLDPQLVWKGKDEQDREPLEVDIVPIYIQEVIEPRVIIEAVQARKTTKPDNSGFLPGFFDDFDALEFDRKIEFYQHDQKWANRMILGNSLHVMTSLAEKEGLKGKVQMIYIDPPYGIKFGSNWQVSTRKRDVKDGKVEDATRQPEQMRAFRDTWKLGIHSYLAYLRDRLGRRPGTVDGNRERFRPDRRRERASCPDAFWMRYSGATNFVCSDHLPEDQRDAGASCMKRC